MIDLSVSYATTPDGELVYSKATSSTSGSNFYITATDGSENEQLIAAVSYRDMYILDTVLNIPAYEIFRERINDIKSSPSGCA